MAAETHTMKKEHTNFVHSRQVVNIVSFSKVEGQLSDRRKGKDNS